MRWAGGADGGTYYGLGLEQHRICDNQNGSGLCQAALPHSLLQRVRVCLGREVGGEGLCLGLGLVLSVHCVLAGTLGGGCGGAEGRLGPSLSGLPGIGGGLEGAWLPAPTLVSMDAKTALTGPWQQVRGPGKAPWRGWACSSPPPRGLWPPAASSVFPGERLGFLLAAQGLLGREDEPASFLMALEAWGTGAVVLC